MTTKFVEPEAILDNYWEPGQISTLTGRVVRPWFMQPSDFSLEDIGPALSKLCRYAGQIPTFYSVAEHCCNVVDLVRKAGIDDLPTLRAAFLHDASEAYLVDMPSPVKNLAAMKPYRDAEDRIQEALGERYGFNLFDPTTAAIVKECDVSAYRSETQFVRTGLVRGALPDEALSLWRAEAATLSLRD